MKTIKASEINRVIAELLEPELVPVAWKGISKGGAWEWSVRKRSWQPLDFEHDPRGTMLLLAKLQGGDRIILEGIGDAMITNWACYRPSWPGSQSRYGTPQEAIAHAFLRAHYIEVEE